MFEARVFGLLPVFLAEVVDLVVTEENAGDDRRVKG